jgi:hypothetical protein
MRFTMGPVVGTIFFSSLALFSGLFVWMLSLAVRIKKIERARLEKEF